MKKEVLLVVLTCMAVISVRAQTLAITGYGGYTFRDKVNFGNAFGYVNESGLWGVSVEGIDQGGRAIEILYQHQSTHTPLAYYAFPNVQINTNTDETVFSFLMLNFLHYMQTGTVQPYGGIGLGAAFINNKSYTNETRFAWDAKLGVKFLASPLIGIKLQAQLFSIVQAAGSDFYVGNGGTGVSVSSYSSIFQFGFSGGICFHINKSLSQK